MLKNKTILVTGGLGFIGKNIIKILNDTNKVIIIDKISYVSDKKFLNSLEGVRLIHKDIADFKIASHLYPDELEELVILNFAAESHVDNSFSNSIDFTRSNVLALHYFLEEIVKYSNYVKFLHVSTDEVYGDKYLQPRNELSNLQPTNPYSASKAAADTLVQTYHRCFNLDTKIIRPNNIYGSGQYVEKLIPKIFSHIQMGKPFPIHGSGNNRRHFLHTSDLLTAIHAIFEHWNNDSLIYNISSDDEYSVNEILQMIKHHIAPSLEWVTVEDRPYNDEKYLIDDARLRSLGWAPASNFLQELLEISKEPIHGFSEN